MNVLVTITYNAMKDNILPPFFACLAAQSNQDFIVLVIDNASNDGTAEYLSKLDIHNLRVILNNENIGFGRACNQGIDFSRSIKADYITLINNDTEFSSELIEKMALSLEENNAVALTPLITYYNDPEKIWFLTGSFRWERGMIPYHNDICRNHHSTINKKIYSTEFAPGCCLILKADIFDVVSKFDERYFVYWEDSDFCLSLKENDLKVVVDASLECRHKVSVSTGGAFSTFSIFHFNRGHMIFVRKHFGAKALIFVLPVVVVKALINLGRGRMSIRQIPIWVRGILSGFRG